MVYSDVNSSWRNNDGENRHNSTIGEFGERSGRAAAALAPQGVGRTEIVARQFGAGAQNLSEPCVGTNAGCVLRLA